MASCPPTFLLHHSWVLMAETPSSSQWATFCSGSWFLLTSLSVLPLYSYELYGLTHMELDYLDWNGQNRNSLCECCQASDQSAEIIRCSYHRVSYLVRVWRHPIGIDCTDFVCRKVLNIIMPFAAVWIKAIQCDWIGCVSALKQNTLPITTNHSQLVSKLL